MPTLDTPPPPQRPRVLFVPVSGQVAHLGVNGVDEAVAALQRLARA